MSSSSSSSLSASSSRRSIGEENNENPPPTGMLLEFQKLEEQIIATTTTTCNTTQLRNVPSIIDIGRDITIEDIQSAKQELINQKVDLKMDVNENQALRAPWSNIGWMCTPLNLCCMTGNLLIVRLLFLIGADCTHLYWFPMLAAAERGNFDICKWLFEYGGDAKNQINKETFWGDTPLLKSYEAWHDNRDKDGNTCRWLLQNGGGQHLRPLAMRSIIAIEGKEKTNSNLLVMWMRESIQLYDTFILFLCGATTMITTSSSSSLEPGDGSTRKCKRKRKLHKERSLQILDGHPGIMELVGNYVNLIRGKELRMLKEFNELYIEYNNIYQSNRDDDDDDDDDDESSSDDDNDYDNGENEE